MPFPVVLTRLSSSWEWCTFLWVPWCLLREKAEIWERSPLDGEYRAPRKSLCLPKKRHRWEGWWKLNKYNTWLNEFITYALIILQNVLFICIFIHLFVLFYPSSFIHQTWSYWISIIKLFIHLHLLKHSSDSLCMNPFIHSLTRSFINPLIDS